MIYICFTGGRAEKNFLFYAPLLKNILKQERVLNNNELWESTVAVLIFVFFIILGFNNFTLVCIKLVIRRNNKTKTQILLMSRLW